MKIEGRKAIVTGAAKGMGAAITTTLAREGADIVLTARDIAPLVEVAAAVRAMGRESWVVGCDVTDDAEVREMVGKALEVFGGRIDILVNVAGVTGPIETPVQDIDVADFDHVVTTNERGTFLPIKYVVPTMITQMAGKIVNISGTSGLRGYAMRSAYSASKWAVRGITRTVALELGKYNINVNAVCPGIVDGPRMQNLCEEKANVTGLDGRGGLRRVRPGHGAEARDLRPGHRQRGAVHGVRRQPADYRPAHCRRWRLGRVSGPARRELEDEQCTYRSSWRCRETSPAP